MARTRLFALALAGISLTGCVSQDKYNALKLEKDQLVEQLSGAQSAESAARAKADAVQSQLDALLKNQGDASLLIRNQGDELAAIKAQLADVNAKYENALKTPGNGTLIINQELNNSLADLAKQNPDVLEFDAARGILKFKSDVTFAKGSADVTPQAKDVISKVAAILNSPVANNYEFLVAGHTDSTPVNNPATKQNGHKDNWYLSAHRAITVGQSLIGDQVNPRRVGCVGYADQHPVASNATSDGQAKNRRVEIVILPTAAKGNGGVGNTSTVTSSDLAPRRTANVAQKPAAGNAFNKDSGAPIAPAPVYNKDSTVAVPVAPIYNK